MNELPISHILPKLNASLEDNHRLLVVAPPGAGKSTLLPLSLLEKLGQSNQQIWLLEPRRLAAAQVANRLAESLGETLGKRIGLITGEQSITHKDNQLVVMTEGVMIQKLLKHNDIEDCALVIFDEFHERSLQSDLALALCIQCQDYLRDDLKLIIMSATLDSHTLEAQLDATTLVSEGRSYPVTVEYRSATSVNPRANNQGAQFLAQQVQQCIKHALNQHLGDILVFLPGIKEISQTQQLLEGHDDLAVLPLHGNVPSKHQQAILKPNKKRKVILATDIAKTSLTIEGITVVIDSGLERLAQFNAKSQMNELITVKASQASCIQRTGRAGRLQAGHCYRLFSEDDFNLRPAFTQKAIESEDLSQFSLSLASWGSLALEDYVLLDQPDPKRWQNSLTLLTQLNALNPDKQLTDHGKLISQLPLHPRLSHMLMAAKNLQPADLNLAYTACYVAAILSEGDPLFFHEPNSDLETRLHLFESQSLPQSFMHGQVKHHVAKRIKTLANRLCQMIGLKQSNNTLRIDAQQAGLLIMLAYPDRLGQKRGKGYRLSQGLGCQFMEGDAMAKSDFIAVAHVSSMKRNGGTQTTIRLAANIQLDTIIEFNEHLIETKNQVIKNDAGKLINQKQTCLGQLVLNEVQTAASSDQFLDYWLNNLKLNGLEQLNLSIETQATLKRLQLAHEIFPTIYLDYSEATLLAQLDNWLVPFIQENGFNEKTAQQLNIGQALLSRLDWDVQQQLDKDFPTRFALPSGRSCHIDYSDNPPFAKAKLQEFFGLPQSPTLARGQLTLNLHLLSPAQRPLAQTSDLAFFWQNAYPEVRKENRGRYAKHPWPEDPLTAIASHKTKKHLDNS